MPRWEEEEDDDDVGAPEDKRVLAAVLAVRVNMWTIVLNDEDACRDADQCDEGKWCFAL